MLPEVATGQGVFTPLLSCFTHPYGFIYPEELLELKLKLQKAQQNSVVLSWKVLVTPV